MRALTVINAYDPIFADPEGNSVNLRVRFKEFPDPIPFLATRNDNESHGKQLFIDAVSGKYGSVGAYPISKEQQLINHKKKLCNRIDGMAESLRGKFLTPGVGQAVVYQRKLDEAIEHLQAGYLQSSGDHYPLLNAGVGINGGDISEVARSVVNAHNKWIEAAAEIERVRLSGKKEVNKAISIKDATNTFNALIWPSA